MGGLQVKKQVYALDEKGFLKEIYVAEVDERGSVVKIDSFDISDISGDIITKDLPNNLYKPKWNGTKWVEGESESEREEREFQQIVDSLNPTERELLKADRELETIELLLEMGLI